MARDDAPLFSRGETAYNGMTINASDPAGLVGVNWEGKEFVFEPDGPYQPAGSSDPNGRQIRVKVVRNRSAVNLKPGRLVHYDESGTYNLETGVDGYCYQLADRPAGIVDEYLPAAGVPPNDLFYIVIDGPSKVTNQHAAPITAAVGNRLVPAATGTGRTDDLAGRVALQDLTGATATLGNNIQNVLGFAAIANSTADAQFSAVIDTHDD